MGRLGEPEQSEGDTSPRNPGPTFYTSDMSYGLHWEWRGFGRLDQAARERIERLQPIGVVSAVVDRYVWCPRLAVNVKLREWPGGQSLKLKRLLRRDQVLDVELWEERPDEDYSLPLSPEDLRVILSELGWEHVQVDTPVDRGSLEELLTHAAPGVRLVSVAKRRRAFATAVGDTPVRVELVDITQPEKLTSIGIEDQLGLDEGSPAERYERGRDAVCSTRDELTLNLESRSYLDALALWVRGARLVPSR